MTWNHIAKDETVVHVLDHEGLVRVELDPITDADVLRVDIEPADACRMATELVRSAGRANGTSDPVSVYMPRDQWDALVALAESADVESHPDKDKARLAIRCVRAVLSYAQESPGDTAATAG